jgi:hypothetical protein
MKQTMFDDYHKFYNNYNIKATIQSKAENKNSEGRELAAMINDKLSIRYDKRKKQLGKETG